MFENVTGILSARDGDGTGHFDAMRRLFRRLGYETGSSVLSAKDYGVLQNRKRVVLVGHREGFGAIDPEPERWEPDATVSEIFRDLPPLGAGEGQVAPCRRIPYESRWRVAAGVSSSLPTYMAPGAAPRGRDLEIYRLAVTQWNERRSRLRYDTLYRRTSGPTRTRPRSWTGSR